MKHRIQGAVDNVVVFTKIFPLGEILAAVFLLLLAVGVTLVTTGLIREIAQ